MYFEKRWSPSKKGALAEKIACRFLRNRGHRILEKNYRVGRYEIDIIAEKEGMISFIEVKMEKKNAFKQTDLKVTKDKRKRIIYSAKHFLHASQFGRNVNFRFDIVRVVTDGSEFEVIHIENAFSERAMLRISVLIMR